MRSCTQFLAFAVATGFCIAPASSSEKLLFDPPPGDSVQEAKTLLTKLLSTQAKQAERRTESTRKAVKTLEVAYRRYPAAGQATGDPPMPLPAVPIPDVPVPTAKDTAPESVPEASKGPKQPVSEGKVPVALPDERSPIAEDKAPETSTNPADEPTPAEPPAKPKPPSYDPGYPTLDENAGQNPFFEEPSSCQWSPGCGDGCGTGSPACCGSSSFCGLFGVSKLAGSAKCWGIKFGGWLDQGVTLNAVDSSDRFNGPVTFNDRASEYQLNQAYLFAERKTDNGGWGFDVGGRVDMLFGSDSRFVTSAGLDDDWDTNRFYGFAMPQAYLDVAYNKWTVRMGHFYTNIGYEVVPAPENFFYSHSYTMQYGEPFTHTGLLAMYQLGDRWTASAGFHRGWNLWEDNNQSLGFLGGLTWTSTDKRSEAAFSLTSSNETNAGNTNRFLYSFVIKHRINEKLRYIFQHDLGYEDDGAVTRDAQWYGIVNYLLYDLNPCWSFGLRYEWFNDDDGTRVTGANGAGGAPRGIALAGVPTNWQELSLGLNWSPHDNVVFRSECRWDFAKPHNLNIVGGPFNDFTDRHQFTWGNDLIIKF